MRSARGMKNPSSALPRNLEYHLGLMAKQIRRVGKLAKFLPLPDQQGEINTLVKRLTAGSACLSSLAFLASEPTA